MNTPDAPQTSAQDVKPNTPSTKALVIGSAIVATALAAHISNYLGAPLVASILAVLVLIALTASLLWFLVHRAKIDAVGSDAVKAGNSITEQVWWKVLWTVPVLLFTFGFFGDLLGFKEVGKGMGVAAVILLLPIIPTYIIMAITRAVRQKKHDTLI